MIHLILIVSIIICLIAAVVSAIVLLLKCILWLFNRKKIKYKTAAIVFIISAVVVYSGQYLLFNSMLVLPKGTLISTTPSPDQKNAIKLYEINGGATTSIAIRGELVASEGLFRHKNIYWSYRDLEEKVIWIDNDTVEINGHRLQIHQDKYDYRRQ